MQETAVLLSFYWDLPTSAPLVALEGIACRPCGKPAPESASRPVTNRQLKRGQLETHTDLLRLHADAAANPATSNEACHSCMGITACSASPGTRHVSTTCIPCSSLTNTPRPNTLGKWKRREDHDEWAMQQNSSRQILVNIPATEPSRPCATAPPKGADHSH